MRSSKFKEVKKKFPMKLGCNGGHMKTTQPKVVDQTSKMIREKTWSAHKWCRCKNANYNLLLHIILILSWEQQ
jgi:hypothetical protein